MCTQNHDIRDKFKISFHAHTHTLNFTAQINKYYLQAKT